MIKQIEQLYMGYLKHDCKIKQSKWAQIEGKLTGKYKVKMFGLNSVYTGLSDELSDDFGFGTIHYITLDGIDIDWPAPYVVTTKEYRKLNNERYSVGKLNGEDPFVSSNNYSFWSKMRYKLTKRW